MWGRTFHPEHSKTSQSNSCSGVSDTTKGLMGRALHLIAEVPKSRTLTGTSGSLDSVEGAILQRQVT